MNRLVSGENAQLSAENDNDHADCREAIASAELTLWHLDVGQRQLVLTDYVDIGSGRLIILNQHHSFSHYCQTVVHPDDCALLEQAIEAHLRGEAASIEVSYRLQKQTEGPCHWLLCRGRVSQRDALGQPLYAKGTLLDISQKMHTERMLKLAFYGTPGTVGGTFLRDMVRYLARLQEVKYAFIGEYVSATHDSVFDELALYQRHKRQDTIIVVHAACGSQGSVAKPFSYPLAGTPCEQALKQQTYHCYSGVARQYPNDQLLQQMSVDSYYGYCLVDEHGAPIGLIALLDDKPMQGLERLNDLMRVFAPRASAELQRLQAERTVHRRAQQFRSIVEATPMGMHFYRWSEECQQLILEGTNTTASRILNIDCEAVVGKTLAEAFASCAGGELAEQYAQIARFGGTLNCEEVYYQSPTFTGYFDVYAFQPEPYRVTVMFNDITEKKLMAEALKESQAQLRQSQKMEAIGQLAGGIAHDFNNLLQVINGHAELLLLDTALSQEVQEEVSAIADAGARASRLIAQLLAFSRQQTLKSDKIDLNATINDLYLFLVRTIGKSIKLSLTPWHKALCICADRSMIEQIAINLCINARDAMTDGGELTIALAPIEAAQIAHLMHLEGDPSKRVDKKCSQFARLTVSDTGHGIDRLTQKRIFEPYFTTKPQGKGTGLGLSTVYGIVKQHGGYIEVDSVEGVGTTFQIYLPMQPEGRAEESASLVATDLNGSETILFAEDDEQVRWLGQQILQAAGYRVLVASDGQAAVERFIQAEGTIDLLVFDLIMPVLGGFDAYHQISAQASSIPVLFCSGYGFGTLNVELMAGRRFAQLQKPFSRQELLYAIRRLIDSPVNIHDVEQK